MLPTLFHLVLCLSRLSRHSVVAPTLAAPLLIDIRRSTVGSGTREDIERKLDEMRSCLHEGWHEVLYFVLQSSTFVFRLLTQVLPPFVDFSVFDCALYVDINEFQTKCRFEAAQRFLRCWRSTSVEVLGEDPWVCPRLSTFQLSTV